jgi:hypothetical protein
MIPSCYYFLAHEFICGLENQGYALAVKKGDVNGSNNQTTNMLVSSSERTILEDITSNQLIEKGSKFKIELSQKAFNSIEAFQHSLNFNPENLKVLKVVSTSLKDFNSEMYFANNEDGFCNIVWFDAINRSKEMKITLSLETLKDINSGETIFDLGKGKIPSVFYESQGAVGSVSLESRLEIEGKTEFVVSNPMEDKLVVFMPNTLEDIDLHIQLFRGDGSLILSQKARTFEGQLVISNNEIATLSSGSYFVRITSGNLSYSKSLIKI